MGWYQTPPDTNEPDKIIGGVLTLVQLAWIAGGAVIAAGIVVILRFLFPGYFWVLGLLFLPSGVPFALFKKKGMPLPKYLLLKFKFRQNPKYYINQIATSGDLTFDERRNDYVC